MLSRSFSSCQSLTINNVTIWVSQIVMSSQLCHYSKKRRIKQCSETRKQRWKLTKGRFLGNHVQGTNKTQRFFNPFTCGNVNLKRKEEFILDYNQKYSTRPDLQYSFQHGFHVTFDLILFDSTLVLRIVFVVGSVSMDFWRGEMSKTIPKWLFPGILFIPNLVFRFSVMWRLLWQKLWHMFQFSPLLLSQLRGQFHNMNLYDVMK